MSTEKTHVEQVDLAKVNHDDMVIAALLKVRHPDIYKTLKKEAKAK